MEKLIELDVAIDTAIDAADEWDCGFSFERDRKIRDAFMALPTVDAVPVVRCKDCNNCYLGNPCIGCSDYLPPNGCKSNGGCGKDGETHD